MATNTENKRTSTSFLKEIGERIVAYELRKRGWEVMLNLGTGFDLLIKKKDVSRRVEVKTTDPIEKKGKHKKHLRQRVTSNEKKICDFVIYYMHGYNAFFIIPIKEIGKNNAIYMYLGRKKIGGRFSNFKDKWDLLE